MDAILEDVVNMRGGYLAKYNYPLPALAEPRARIGRYTYIIGADSLNFKCKS
jgi:hypothetical protein